MGRSEPKGMVMLRGLIVGIGGVAVMVAGLVGCSSDKKTDNSSATSGSVTVTAGAGTTKVSIDGQPTNVDGQIACTTAMGNLNIAIGNAATGIAVVLVPDASAVKSVGLGMTKPFEIQVTCEKGG